MNGKIALVTGGGSGMGRAAAAAFGQRGATVVVADIDEQGATETARLLPEGHAAFVATDVTHERDVAAAIAFCVERYGGIDFLHNNVGIAGSNLPVHETDDSDWDRIVGVNLRGAWLVLKHSLLAMRAQGHGSIVNMGSVAGHTAVAGSGAYNAAKAGVLMLTRTAATENGDRGIRVNAVAPGMIVTPMTQKWVDASDTFPPPGPGPLGRFGLAEEVAAAVVWLCSDDASFVNGVCLTVDGGWTTSAPERAPIAADQRR
jgi:NAD(P)-dependent dehydrogenase (short-subunit alcohol dehydrogenase family)